MTPRPRIDSYLQIGELTVLLLDLGVQLGQGYLFDEPLTLGRPDAFSKGS
ncbi:MAG TPA: hypothetical protein VLA91_14640 [Acidimicrobiia bacterium]|nr:hypothetical protein [Acidimicrobiia bacterium]